MRWGLALFSLAVLGAAGVAAYIFLVAIPNLPPVDKLLDYRPKIPLRIYTADNVLIGEFGPEHRDFVPIKQIPKVMKQALLATEDDRFYEHGGIDYLGILRAALADLHGGLSQGGSTITMQVARNFFLTREKTITRKLNEILLSYKIEQKLTKDQILELYMNQIYLGERAYGFATAAQTYFGKPLQDITIAEAAMLAGLPKAPTANNPVVNPKRAKQRQRYILRRMRDLGYITPQQYQQALQEKLEVRGSGQGYKVHAEYVAEQARAMMVERFKDDAYTKGYNVYTTIDSHQQAAAYAAVRRSMLAYDRRHGYRGPEAGIDLPADEDDREQAIDDLLLKHPASDELQPAVVLSASPKLVKAELLSGDVISISGEGLRFAAAGLSARAKDKLRIRRGSLIRVTQDDKAHWEITQLPDVSAALVALDTHDGSYRALVGGFDFDFSKFNHATSAWRQPGSSIKPFIYSAALEKGFSPNTVINDAPLVIPASYSGGEDWAPHNDDQFDGPITLRTALAKSKNVVSVRVLRAIGVPYARDYMTRFGFDLDKQPPNLTLALGTGSTTPLQMAGAYAVFANGGFRINPYLVSKVTDERGNLIARTTPVLAGQESERVIDSRNAFIMDTLLRQVVRTGTGAAATQRLGRSDLAGKTGTTSDAMDGWFAGYAENTVAVSWMGYDEPKSLGRHEFGATVALPIWIDFMHAALADQPETRRPVPLGVALVDGDWMYSEFAESGAVRTLGFDGGAPPMTDGASLVPPPSSAQARQRVLDLFSGD